jgi:hypothetical protein
MATTIDKENPVEMRGDVESTPIGLKPQVSSVVVIFTSTKRTLRALEKANELAENLQTKIMVVAAQVVPFPMQLDQPPVPFEFVIKQFASAVANLDGIRIVPYLCRDQFEAYKRILRRNSPVVIGIKKRWWSTREERLARKLQRAGFNMVLVETE